MCFPTALAISLPGNVLPLNAAEEILRQKKRSNGK